MFNLLFTIDLNFVINKANQLNKKRDVVTKKVEGEHIFY